MYICNFTQYARQLFVVQSWQMGQGLVNGMWLKVPLYFGNLQSHGFQDFANIFLGVSFI